MQAFKTIESIAAYLPIANIDTDMIIAKQYLKTIKRTGLGKYLFAEMRYDEKGDLKANFILNQQGFNQAQILLTGENFGCGSSREHAVWSLVDFGIRVVIAPSFADIFYSNCFKNGLLPIVLPSSSVEQLVKKNHKMTVDLEFKTISTGDLNLHFSIDDYRRRTLLLGLDEIGETLIYEKEIATFEIKQRVEQPWLYGGENHE